MPSVSTKPKRSAPSQSTPFLRSRAEPRASTPPVPMAERILAGASRAFGRLGYAALRVEDILLEAGISRPTFYKFFATKDEVFQLLSERHHHDIRERIRSVALSGDEPAVLLPRMVDAFLAWRAGLGPIGRVLDVEARTPGSVIATQRKKTLGEMSALLGPLARVKKRRAAEDPVFVLALIAALESVADSLLCGRRVEPEALLRAKQVARRLLSGVLVEITPGV